MHAFRLRHADRIVSIFLLAVLSVLIVVAVLVVKGQELFAERVMYWSIFDSAEGLTAESPVRIAGLDVGKITKVELTDDDRVRVELEILQRYTDRLVADADGLDCNKSFDRPKGCGSRLVSPGGLGLGAIFTGGAGLVIQVGQRDNARIAPGGYVPSEAEEGIMARLEREGLLEQLREIVSQASLMLARVNAPEGPFWKSLYNLEQVTSQAQSGEGVLGELMQPQSPLYRKVQASLSSLQKSMAQVENSTTHIQEVTGGVQAEMGKLTALISNLEKFSNDAAEAGRGLKRFAIESQKVPPATHEAIVNLNQRIDELGEVIRSIKKGIPFGLAAEPNKQHEAAKKKAAGE